MIDLGDIRLRKFEDRDIDDLYLFRNDSRITAELGGFSTGYSRKDLVAWMEYHRARQDEVLWAVVSHPEDRCIGHVGLYHIDHRVAKAEFAIVIGSLDFQGRGVGRRVSNAVLEFGFRELRLNKISLTVLSSNARAKSLYDALSFIPEGQLRDEQFRDGEYQSVILMAVFADHWTVQNPGSSS